VPGVKADDLDISVEGRQLTIRASLPAVPEGEQRRYWLQAIPRGPSPAPSACRRTSTWTAFGQRHDGMLTLRMAKVAEAKVRKIEIENS
jgi:HSP20 family protein